VQRRTGAVAEVVEDRCRGVCTEEIQEGAEVLRCRDGAVVKVLMC